MQIQKHHFLRTMLAILLMLCSSGGLALGQAQPATPVMSYQFRTAGLPQSGRFQLVHNILTFEPGAATPFHRHPGQVLVTVLEGENTFTSNGVEKVYKAGESFVEEPNQPVQARNAGSTRLRVMATLVLPLGAPNSHPEPGDATPAPRPTTSSEFKTEVEPMSGPFDVAHAIVDFAPGAASPYHTHPGTTMVTVVEGELTLSRDGVDHVFKVGESFVEPANRVVQARNATGGPTRTLVSFVVPPGAPLSAPQSAPAAPQPLPDTGEAGSPPPALPEALPDTGRAGADAPLAPRSLPDTGAAESGAWVRWILMLAVLQLLGTGWVLRRRARQG